MITFQVCGYSDTGKTTVVKKVIERLVQQNQKVASLKSIHSEDFQIDQTGKDTYIHSQTGANPVVACGLNETDILYNHNMDFKEIADKISADWLIVEGLNNFPLPKIVCGKTEADLNDFVDRRTFAISGIISQELREYCSIPVFNVHQPERFDQLFYLIKRKTFPLLPYVDENCCKLCGLSCSKLVEAIIQDEKSYQDCVIHQKIIQLKIGGKEIPMVPFVQRLLYNSVLGIVSELSGWEKDKKIEIIIN